MLPLTPEEGAELVRVAREALRLKIACGESYHGSPTGSSLLALGAAFVTLKRRGVLRGCIGQMAPSQPLHLMVADCAIAAATRDPRFDPVRKEELDDMGIEISVLGPMEIVDDVTRIEIGKHGLYIQKGGQHGVLLPQVAVEHRLDRDEFLNLTCRKAGLAPDAWKRGAIVKVFTAQIFHSEAL